MSKDQPHARYSRSPFWACVWIAIVLIGIGLPDLDLALRFDPNPTPLREEVPFPVPHFDRSALKWPGNFIWYLQSSMGLRGALVRARGLIAYLWLGVSPAPVSVLRRDPWLFLKDERVLDDFRRNQPLSAQQLDRWRRVIEGRHRFLEQRGIDYLLVLAPNKETVYADAMPPWATRQQRPSRLEQLVERLRGAPALPLLDLSRTLIAARAAGRVYHYTDTHWNDVGAFAAYREIAGRLNQSFPGLRSLTDSDMVQHRVTTPGGDLARMCGLQLDLREPQTQLELKPGVEPARFEDGSALSFERMDVRGHERFTSRRPDGEIASAVILRDSFGEALIPYLARHFATATWIWTYDFPAELIAKLHPKVVIEELVERKLMVLEPGDPP